MPISTTRGTPGWYAQRLLKKLSENRKTVDPLFDRYEGEPDTPDWFSTATESSRRFYKAARTSFAEMIVKAVKYPLRVQSVGGVSTGDDAALERLFAGSGMRGESPEVIRKMLVAGNAYAITAMYTGEPVYTAEDPRQVVTIQDPVVQSRTIAALKVYYDAEAEQMAVVMYRPGHMWRACRAMKSEPRNTPTSLRGFEWDETAGGEDGMAFPVENFMPVIRYRNEEGVGEFERHRDLLDRLDHMILQGMTIATMQAHKQRAIIAPDDAFPDEDEDGNAIDWNAEFPADPGALWRLPETAKMWESGGVDLTPVWTGMEKFIQQLSAVTFTPLAMFSPDGQNQSAAGSAFAREGRTFKIEDRQDSIGESHAQALANLAVLAASAGAEGLDSFQSRGDVRVVWRPAERYSLAEKADALTKFKAADVPWETRMLDVYQATPDQIKSMQSQRMDDLMWTPAEAAVQPSPQAG